MAGVLGQIAQARFTQLVEYQLFTTNLKSFLKKRNFFLPVSATCFLLAFYVTKFFCSVLDF